MIEVRMERVINQHGSMGLKIRTIKALPKKALPYKYTGSTDVRCWQMTYGGKPAMALAGLKGKIIPSPWDADDEAKQAYAMDSAFLQEGSEHGWPCVAASWA